MRPQHASAAPPLAPGTVLARMGAYEVRLARNEEEVEAAQRLRFRVFFGEGEEGCDADHFDGHCDHVVVVDKAARERIVGTYRLLRGEEAEAAGGFYSAGEFDVEPLLRANRDERFLELGRSCVDPAHRARGAAEAMWAGIWSYVGHHRLTVMLGCASFAGTVPALHAPALSLLAHEHRAEARWRVRARPERFREMDLMPPEAIDRGKARAALPPLLRGYLRLGALVGEGCVVDEGFGTTDVFVVLPVGRIGERYIAYYGARRAA